MDIQAYLNRIHYQGPVAPGIETLRALHRAHMLAVPFENLDIPLRRPIVLDEELLFDKIVNRRRGGFCFELNGLFSALLRELGFDVQRLSARMSGADGGFGIDFGHMTLMVQLEQRWLADVGGGDSFLEPLCLDDPGEQAQDTGRYRIALEGDHGLCLRRKDSDWEPVYLFRLQPYTLADFSQACEWTQTSPLSSFTQRRVCTRPTPGGRVTLKDLKWITTTNGTRLEQMLESEAEAQAILRQYFEIYL